MKYYKRVNTTVARHVFEIGKIYPETYQDNGYLSVKKSTERNPDRWQEVTLQDYIDQEGGWYIRGSEEFREFVDQQNIDRQNNHCDMNNVYYTIENNKVISYYYETPKGIEINIEQLKELFMSKESGKFAVRVNPTTSKILQELAFENGYTWNIMNTTDVSCLDGLYLNFYPNKNVFTWSNEQEYKSVSLEQAIELIETPQFRVGDWVFVEYGGNGSSGCDGHIGKVINKPKSKPIGYSGQIWHKTAELYIQLPNNTVWGLCKGNKLRKATPEEIKQATKITIGEYEVEFENNVVSIGCQHYTKSFVKELTNVLDNIDGFRYIAVHDHTIDKETITKISERLS